jgi:UDP-N-acetylmuramate dehydrogenase
MRKNMITTQRAKLAPYTSFECGGETDQFVIIENYSDTQNLAALTSGQQIWMLGYGCNVLVSDKGLPGTSLLFRGGEITLDDNTLIADAGVWWDELVIYAIDHQLFGLELMSGIPGGVAAAVVGNIAAYGQAVADTISWIEVFDTETKMTKSMSPEQLAFGYRYSNLQEPENRRYIVLRAAFTLSHSMTHELKYQTALDVAERGNHDTSSLEGRRQSILGARELAGSLWDYRESNHSNKTAGSFFRNPQVTAEQAERIIRFDETGKSADLIKQMNTVHGGDSLRVSAAHVLLAAGFTRGQTWGDVRLHPQHVLKIENVGNASAQDIYNVAQEIIRTTQEKLGITLVPEVRFLGEFDD